MADAGFFNRLRPYATEQVTVSGSTSLTTAKVDNTANYPDFKAAGAIVDVKNADIYYTVDGSTPSSTNGVNAFNGDIIPLAGYQKIKNFKAIQQSGTPLLNVQYFKN